MGRQVIAVWALFGEWIMALGASVIFCWAIRSSKLKKLAFTLAIAFFLVLLCLIQRPWRPEGKLSVVASARFGSNEVAVVQVHDALSLNFLSFVERNTGGSWREYYLEKEAPFWLTAGFHQPNSNEIAVTRLGVRIATFKISERKLVLEVPTPGSLIERPFGEERPELSDWTF